MIKKPLKANLIIDGRLCRSIEDIVENFNLIDILNAFFNGSLQELLKNRRFTQLAEVEMISKQETLNAIAAKLCEIFEIQINEALLEREVEAYQFSQLSEDEKSALNKNEPLHTLNAITPAIRTIRIKNNGKILNSKFRFIPIQADIHAEIKDFLGNHLSIKKIKDSFIFNGLIVEIVEKAHTFNLQDTNIKQALNIYENILRNFFDWKLNKSEESKLKCHLYSLKQARLDLDNYENFWQIQFEIAMEKDNRHNNRNMWMQERNNFYYYKLESLNNAIQSYTEAVNQPHDSALIKRAQYAAELVAEDFSRYYRKRFSLYVFEKVMLAASDDSHNSYSFVDSMRDYFYPHFIYFFKSFLNSLDADAKDQVLKNKFQIIKNIKFDENNYAQLNDLCKDLVSDVKTGTIPFELTLMDLYNEIEHFKNENWELVK